MANLNEQRESDIQYLRQLCCFITTDPYDILDHRLSRQHIHLFLPIFMTWIRHIMN